MAGHASSRNRRRCGVDGRERGAVEEGSRTERVSVYDRDPNGGQFPHAMAPVPPTAQPARLLQPVHRRLRSTPIDWSSTEAISRGLAISAVAAIALIHLLDAPDTYSSTRYIFWLYVGLVATRMPVITMLMRWRSSSVWVGTAALAAGPFVGYIASRSVGLPGDPSDVGNWLNSLGMASLLIEALLIALSIIRLRLLAQAAARSLSSRRSLSVTACSAAAQPGRPSNQSRRRVAVSHFSSTTNHRSLMPHSLPVRCSILLAVAVLTATLAVFALQGSAANAAGTQVLRLSAKLTWSCASAPVVCTLIVDGSRSS